MPPFWSLFCRRFASASRRWAQLLAVALCCLSQATAQTGDPSSDPAVAVDEEPLAENPSNEPLVAYRRDELVEEPETRRFDVEPSSSETQSAASTAGHEGAGPSIPGVGDDGRRLTFSSAARIREGGPQSRSSSSKSLFDRLASPPGARGALLTAATGLGVVVALLLVSTWALKRRNGPAPGALPPEAFSMLGRAQLADRTVVQLFRLGNKLVLTAPSPEGHRPLTEITDPQEVDRIAGICARGRLHGPAAEFQQVLAQLAREPARGFLGGEARSR